MFIGTGIMYIIMGSIYFFKEKLQLQHNWLSDRIQLSLFITGCSIVLLSIIDIFVNSNLLYILFGLIICIFVITSLNAVSKYLKYLEVMRKLEQE